MYLNGPFRIGTSRGDWQVVECSAQPEQQDAMDAVILGAKAVSP